jgi:uncharacterized membrane protein
MPAVPASRVSAGRLGEAVTAVPDSVEHAAMRPARLVLDQCNLPPPVLGGYHLTVFRSPDRVAGDMIEVVPSSWDGHGAQLRLRPPRALTRRQFVMLFAALSGAMWIVAMLGWWGGNAFAPAFALLHSAILAMALRALWRSGERGEEIRIGPDAVEVTTSGGGLVFHAHPYWVRLSIERGGERISLASSGRRVRVGDFLGPAERQELAGTLQDLLAAASGRNR